MGKISRLAQQRNEKRQIHGAKRKKPKHIQLLDWKRVEIPDGFTLIIDTREQLPLFSSDRYTTLDHYKYIPIVRRDTKIGDYSIVGLEDKVAIERKMQSDFEGYIGAEYDTKTIHKLKALSNCYFGGLIVEANEYDLYEFPIAPNMTREKVRNQLASINAHYHIHTYISDDREMLERWVLDRLVRMYKYLRCGDASKPNDLGE